MSDATIPPLPYTVEDLPYGGHLMPTKRGGDNHILTADEIAVWAHLTAVTAERDALAAKVAELTAAVAETEAAKPARKGK